MIQYFGLIGKDISYSQSPKIWQRIWNERGVSGCIFRILDTPNPFLTIQNVLQSDFNWRGLMVTSPYKTAILDKMWQLTDTAQSVGAINAIKIVGNHLIGHNTDVGGFLKTIESIPIGENTLVLGSGGASKAIQVALQSIGKKVTVVSRTPKQDMLSYEDVSPSLIRNVSLIINATPLGGPKYPSLLPKIPYNAITREHIVYDLSYADKSGFLSAVKAQCKKLDGKEMLYHQACLAYEFFMSL